MGQSGLRATRWFAPSHVTAGFIAVLVGYTSSAAIVFQAAHAANATPNQIASWLCALGIGMGATCIGLSLYYRSPVLTAWSTPGAALLATSLSGVSMSEATGVFIFSSSLLLIVGISGWFDRLMKYIPKALASAMLAGVLLRFGIGVFAELANSVATVGTMLLAYLLAKRWLPRYAVPLTLLAGILTATGAGHMHWGEASLQFAHLEFVHPSFSFSTLIGVGIPLFLVTMASQNLPGVAVLRANGYDLPVSPIIGWTGLTGLVLAPFGGFSFNLAAITAAICMSPDADPDPRRRYLASVWAGLFYLALGLLGATVVSVFAVFPQSLIIAIAGIALLGVIGNSLADSLIHTDGREAALLTFLVTASGFSLFGIGSAFWGLVVGLTAHLLLKQK